MYSQSTMDENTLELSEVSTVKAQEAWTWEAQQQVAHKVQQTQEPQIFIIWSLNSCPLDIFT